MNVVKTISVIIAVSVWLFPAISNATVLPASVIEFSNSTPTTTAHPTITVVDATFSSAQSKISLSPTASLSTASAVCANATLAELDSQDIFNLNQPASCFNLSLNKHLAAQPQVVVAVQSSQTLSIKVIPSAVSIAPPQVIPTLPDAATTPVTPLPQVGLWLTLVGVALLFGGAGAAIKKVASQPKFSLSLSQLQVLRC